MAYHITAQHSTAQHSTLVTYGCGQSASTHALGHPPPHPTPTRTHTFSTPLLPMLFALASSARGQQPDTMRPTCRNPSYHLAPPPGTPLNIVAPPLPLLEQTPTLPLPTCSAALRASFSSRFRSVMACVLLSSAPYTHMHTHTDMRDVGGCWLRVCFYMKTLALLWVAQRRRPNPCTCTCAWLQCPNFSHKDAAHHTGIDKWWVRHIRVHQDRKQGQAEEGL